MKIHLRVLIAFLTLLSLVACGDGGGGSSAKTRTYYIGADEVAWDYAPGGNLVGSGFDTHAQTFLENVPFGSFSGMAVTQSRIGKVYMKALYREYTDDTFTALKPIPQEWEHLGTLGPLIRAEVGDTIKVVFKNNTRFTYSVHPHGVFYNKDSEGAPYNDGTSGSDTLDDAVPPGGTHTYIWPVPERAGPGPDDPSSILWMYHSHVDESDDTYAGLIGPIIISRAGSIKADGTPEDVDREFITMFHVFNENLSQYIDLNSGRYASITDPAQLEELKADPDFEESNLMHSINGYLYGNIPGLRMKKGERVRWYVMGMGTEVDIHTPHWHGQTVLINGMRTDVVSVFPATMLVADMVPDNPGTWLYHCHVNDHLDAGMIGLFTVDP